MAYHGEANCQGVYKSGVKTGQHCTNKAYYLQNGGIYCGTHSDKNMRVELTRNPNAAQIKENTLQTEAQEIEAVSLENRNAGRKGDVIVTKLWMMKAPENVKGYLKVFPNFKHGGRRDGYGCPALSPKSLGPINHIMPNLPSAKNLENFFQYSKIFPFEVDIQGQLLPGVLEARVTAYKDSIPHRHKYDRKILAQYGNANVPLCSVYYDASGNEHRFSYFGSRYFYCKKYEELASLTVEFKYLQQLINNGYNLQIVGYDGYSVNKSLLEHYADTSKPFGHELVLYTLLTIAESEQYPWNIVYNLNNNMYCGVGI